MDQFKIGQNANHSLPCFDNSLLNDLALEIKVKET